MESEGLGLKQWAQAGREGRVRFQTPASWKETARQLRVHRQQERPWQGVTGSRRESKAWEHVLGRRRRPGREGQGATSAQGRAERRRLWGTAAAEPSRTREGAGGWSPCCWEAARDGCHCPASGQGATVSSTACHPARQLPLHGTHHSAGRAAAKNGQELLPAVRCLGTRGGPAGGPRKDKCSQGRVEKRWEGGLPLRPAAPPKGPGRSRMGFFSRLHGRLHPGQVGMSRVRGGGGRRVRGREHGHPLAAGHGAVALTVYSACFFPYHFIHFLNSRSMVCKGQNQTAG